MNVWRNILWGLGEMAWAAAFCLLLAAVATIADGASPTSGEFGRFAAFYVTMAFSAGIILGAGRPLLSSVLGRGIVGFLVALPVVYIALFRPPRGEGIAPDAIAIGSWIAIAAVVGPVGAAYVTIRNRQRHTSQRPDA